AVMLLCLLGAGFVLSSILIAITSRGLRSLSWEMISTPPQRAFYLGGAGGILNAIAGSLCLALGATTIASLVAIPVVLYMHTYGKGKRQTLLIRLALDVMWGMPSIVYGAFVFTFIMAVGLRASLLAGMLTLVLVSLPILTRTFDEVALMVPTDLSESTLALGTTRTELAGMLLRQTVPGLLAGIFLAFARSIGDGASVLFTAGYTDSMPSSLLRPVASLPLAIFFQLSTPFPEVQARAHTAALVLTAIILLFGMLAYVVHAHLGRYIIR
ncbi:MAG: ABC transporter permease subunit, partial [Anaerolineae bacterium]|nr:ABC transporter permease subunit [Anaerolineae bacterium]